jgi:hypothetical protein
VKGLRGHGSNLLGREEIGRIQSSHQEMFSTKLPKAGVEKYLGEPLIFLSAG